MRWPITTIPVSRSSRWSTGRRCELARGARWLCATRQLQGCAGGVQTRPLLHQHLFRQPCRICHRGDGSRLPCVSRKADGDDRRGRDPRGRNREAHRPKTGHRLYPASSPVMDKTDRRSARAWRAFCLPHEPQPAVRRRQLGNPQAADADDVAHRRLRRALCRCHVPDHRRQAETGARHGPAADRRNRRRTCTITDIFR